MGEWLSFQQSSLASDSSGLVVSSILDLLQKRSMLHAREYADIIYALTKNEAQVQIYR